MTAAPVAESWNRLAKKSRLTTVATVGTVASMRTIEIDLDIYTYLLKNAVEVGETASSILRRLLGLSDRGVPQATSTAALQPSDLETHLGSMDFRYCKGVVGRFLSMLGWIYKNHQNEFHKIEKIQGRGRIYFARDVKILHEHGRSVNPKQIPGSPYWVITTTSTDLKQDILASVMKAFGYTDTDIRRATSAIAHSEYASRRQHILDSL